MLKYRLKNALLFSLVALIVVSSCNKDNVSSSQPTLLSFGPSTVKHGENIKFIGTGLDQVTDIVMPVGINISKSQFVSQSSTLIELTVPVESMVGYVTLKIPSGDITTKTVFGADYQMVVSSMTQSAKPGTNITINGNFLNYVKQVTFSQNQKVTQFVSQSRNHLVVTVPMTAQTGGISLTDLAKTPSVVEQDSLGNSLVLLVNLPAATSFSPTSIEQTKNLTITGTDLDLVNEIDFTPGNYTAGISKVTAPFVSQSATQIVVTVPNNATNGALTLFALSGVKVTTTQTVTILQPTITNLPVGRNGTDITVTGTNLNLIGSLVFPDGTPLGTSVSSSTFTNVATDGTSFTVTIPASAIPGNLKLLTIHNYPITVATPPFNITLPVASSYSSSVPGTSLTIAGTDLDLVKSIIFPNGTQSGTTVTSFTSQTPTSIVVTIPTSAVPGTLIFTLTNGYKTAQTLPFGGACVTSFPGTLLFDFSSASQAVWNTGTVDNLSGHTCNGQLTTSNATITSAGTMFQYDIGAVDWTGKTKLHMWAKVEVADVSTMNGAQIFVQPSWSWVANGYWGQAATIFDGNWHEYVITLSGNLTSMNRIGLQILSGGSNVQATVYIDDVWVE